MGVSWMRRYDLCPQKILSGLCSRTVLNGTSRNKRLVGIGCALAYKKEVVNGRCSMSSPNAIRHKKQNNRKSWKKPPSMKRIVLIPSAPTVKFDAVSSPVISEIVEQKGRNDFVFNPLRPSTSDNP